MTLSIYPSVFPESLPCLPLRSSSSYTFHFFHPPICVTLSPSLDFSLCGGLTIPSYFLRCVCVCLGALEHARPPSCSLITAQLQHAAAPESPSGAITDIYGCVCSDAGKMTDCCGAAPWPEQPVHPTGHLVYGFRGCLLCCNGLLEMCNDDVRWCSALGVNELAFLSKDTNSLYWNISADWASALHQPHQDSLNVQHKKTIWILI